MKTRTFVSIMILVLAVFIVVGNCATRRKAISEQDFWNAFSGTWVNTEYSEIGDLFFEQKWIVYPDGKFEFYPRATDTNPSRQGYYFTITEKWIDSEGVIWYKSILQAGVTQYQLGKISDSGKTWEFCSGPDTYPTEIDKSFTRYVYFIRYRQE